MLTSSCSLCGFPTSPRCPSGTLPSGRSCGASAQWDGTSSSPASPSGRCTSMAKGPPRASWSQIDTGEQRREEGLVLRLLTLLGYRPSPSMKPPTFTTCRSTSRETSVPNFGSGFRLEAFPPPHLPPLHRRFGSPSGLRSASRSSPPSCVTTRSSIERGTFSENPLMGSRMTPRITSTSWPWPRPSSTRWGRSS